MARKITKHYDNIHHWLAYNFGKATKCENPECNYSNPKRYNWALLKGKKYEKKRENFWMLCPSCHIKYDPSLLKTEKIRNYWLGSKHTLEHKLNISKGLKGHSVSNKAKYLSSEHNGKLKSIQKRMEIIQRFKKGFTNKTELGKLYGISRQAIGYIIRREKFYATQNY